MASTYSVRIDYHTHNDVGFIKRQRGGVMFGREPVMISTAPAGEGVAVVGAAALEAILADSYLVATPVAAKAKRGPKAAPAAPAAPAESAPAPARKTVKRRGRRTAAGR